MSRESRSTQSFRDWLTGVIVIVATIVAYIGFARVSVGATFIIASVIFVGLVLFLWRVGVQKQRTR